jgi:hypothetical protein
MSKATAIHIGKAAEQTKRSRILALTWLQPLDGEERFEWAVDHLTTDGAMVILSLLDVAAGLILQGHAASRQLSQRRLKLLNTSMPSSAAETSLYPSLIEGFASLQTAVDIHQHGLSGFTSKPHKLSRKVSSPKRARHRSSAGDRSETVHCPIAESCGWRDLRIGSGVRHLSCMSTQV